MVAEDGEAFDPSKHAMLHLLSHIAQKGIQSGSVIGCVAVGPGMQLYSKLKHKGSFDLLRITRGAGYGVIGGLALTGVLGTLKTMNMDQEGLEDRVFRLHYNEGQNRTDRFAAVGGLLGLAAGTQLLPKYSGRSVLQVVRPVNYLGCFAVGTLLGILAHVATRPADTTPNKMVHEMKT